MTVLAAILAIQVKVTGNSQVTAALNQTQAGLQGTANAASSVAQQVSAIGAALATTGFALATSSISAYEDFEKTRRSFVALAGEIEGNKLSDWLSNYATQANASTDALRKAAQMWLGATGDASGVRNLVQGLENLASLGKTSSELERTAKAITDIQGAGTFRAQERNQLVNAGIPLNKVAEQLGVANISQALGRSAKDVVPAILRALNSLPKQPPLFFQQLANQAEALQKALVPTGRVLSWIGGIVLSIGGGFVTVFDFVNRWTSGMAGAVLSIRLIVGGVRALIPLLRQQALWQGIINALQNSGTAMAVWTRLLSVYQKLVNLAKQNAVFEAIIAALRKNWVGLAIAGGIAAAAGVAWYNGAFGGGKDDDSGGGGGSTSPAGRPVRRSDTENIMHRIRARAYA